MRNGYGKIVVEIATHSLILRKNLNIFVNKMVLLEMKTPERAGGRAA
ncbi:hypothetical protein DYBT9275_01224 [Dyadobacter sp. CECT 9275]|uniref:Uncharacterized protein n=1 Tax=Dyadobacter helix TaxID=2822344 RepID=A0A916J8Y2_9BACT|nr:hypothetical protein DYBT9275_01224 [Dyadobacter sp. CECT 9275]